MVMSQVKKSAQYQVQKGWVLIAINDEFLTRGSAAPGGPRGRTFLGQRGAKE